VIFFGEGFLGQIAKGNIEVETPIIIQYHLRTMYYENNNGTSNC
jgi:hypothetical protein